LKACWVPPDIRDQVVDYVQHWRKRTDLGVAHFIVWLGIGSSKFFEWKRRYGRVNEHNHWIPRDHWIEDWEKQAIIQVHREYPLEGYRRLSFMMLDRNTVAVSPSSVYRVLSEAGLLRKWNTNKSLKGTGFVGPLAAHEHWHIDISYLNICGTFYYLCSILDGYSRSILHWEIRESMKTMDVEIILQRAKEKYPHAKPRIISDNGPQFIAKEFKVFIRESGMSHVRTSPYYPQSNGKKERWFRTLKSECIRPKTPLSLEDAKRLVSEFVEYYNTTRLHSSIGYIAPTDKLNGREQEIFAIRDARLQDARERRRKNRLMQFEVVKEQKPVLNEPVMDPAQLFEQTMWLS
jgi:putative transposase